jgi:hypothetical protein
MAPSMMAIAPGHDGPERRFGAAWMRASGAVGRRGGGGFRCHVGTSGRVVNSFEPKMITERCGFGKRRCAHGLDPAGRKAGSGRVRRVVNPTDSTAKPVNTSTPRSVVDLGKDRTLLWCPLTPH